MEKNSPKDGTRKVKSSVQNDGCLFSVHAAFELSSASLHISHYSHCLLCDMCIADCYNSGRKTKPWLVRTHMVTNAPWLLQNRIQPPNLHMVDSDNLFRYIACFSFLHPSANISLAKVPIIAKCITASGRDTERR